MPKAITKAQGNVASNTRRAGHGRAAAAWSDTPLNWHHPRD